MGGARGAKIHYSLIRKDVNYAKCIVHLQELDYMKRSLSIAIILECGSNHVGMVYTVAYVRTYVQAELDKNAGIAMYAQS